MLEFAASLLTAGVAVTLVPAIRRSTPRLIEVLLWIGFVGTALFMVADETNPRASELTVSVAWGAGQLVHTEAALLLAGVKGWALGHRFDIARVVVIGAAADALALAFMEAIRVARPHPQVRLNDWYVLPRTPIPDGARLPLAGLNRRLADATRMGLRSARRTIVTSHVAARLAIVGAHLLRPGHLRLALVKIGLGIERPRPSLEPQASASIRPPLAIVGPLSKPGPTPKQDQGPRHRRPGLLGVSAQSVSDATGIGSRAPREVKNGAAQPRHRRLAS